jgi:hypothetical protein
MSPHFAGQLVSICLAVVGKLRDGLARMLSFVVVGLYTWAITVFFGAVLLDVVYSNLVPTAGTAFSEVADFLLLAGVMTVVAALGAIVLSWRTRIPRDLFVASLAVISLEFLVPQLLPELLREMQGSALASGIRILISGSASVLAFLGLFEFCRLRQGLAGRGG